MNTNAVKLLLVLLVLMPFALAGDVCGFGWQDIGGVCIRDYLVNTATGILSITFMIIGIIFALGSVIGNTKLLHWSETEFYEAVGTALILAIYLSGSYTLDNLIGPAFYGSSLMYPGEKPYTYDSSGNYVERAGAGNWVSVENHVTDYLNGNLNYIKDNVMKDIFQLGGMIGIMSTANLVITTVATTIFMPVAAAFGGVQQFLSVAVTMIFASVVQLKVQLSIVGLWKGLFNILLPLGIVLRAFPQTRSAGGAAIAIAVGFTLVLPVAYMIIEDISAHYWKISDCASQSTDISTDVSSIIGSGQDIFKGVENVQNKVKEYMTGKVFACHVYKIAIEAAILPMFAYLMTLNITKHLAEILGSRVDFSTLVRII